MASIEQLWQRFLILSQREKIMTVATLLLLIWGGWDTLFYQSIQNRNRSLESEIIKQRQQLVSLQQVAKQFETAGLNNPNSASHQQLAELQQSVKNLKQQINIGGKKFVPAESMANALGDMLKQHGALKLIKLETLPVTEFGSNEQHTAMIYRHSLEITLQGDYFSTLEYLKALESLPWRIHWHSIAYLVKAYPLAETRIQVYTLSFEQDWLSV